MLYLVLSLFATHFFLMNPSVIGKGHFEKREEPPFSKVAKIVSETTTLKTPPSQPQQDHEGRKPYEDVSPPGSSEAKCKLNSVLMLQRSGIELTSMIPSNFRNEYMS